MGQTLLRGKQNLFSDLTDNKWRIKFSSNMPQMHTLRDLTLAEKEDKNNSLFTGVRTYFFHANHWRGLPSLVGDSEVLPYDDYAWVPKRKMNEFFTRDYYDCVIDSCLTR